jgi:hypothetical protein
MKRMNRIFVIMALLIGAAIPIGAAGATPALAAGCWADGCAGQDPEAQGCGGETLESATAPGGGGTVELRYSPADCDAAWARGTQSFNIIVQGSTTPDGSNIVAEYGQVGGDTDVQWTDMVSFSLWTRACIEGIYQAGWNCTGWH